MQLHLPYFPLSRRGWRDILACLLELHNLQPDFRAGRFRASSLRLQLVIPISYFNLFETFQFLDLPLSAAAGRQPAIFLLRDVLPIILGLQPQSQR